MLVYDSARFRPPAPVANVVFINPQSGQAIGDVLMLLDTGADSSIVPLAVVEALQSDFEDAVWEITSIASAQSQVLRSAKLQMQLGKYKFNSSFLVASVDVGVIGRNLLNLVRVRLDGPKQHWQFD
jgi:predicted aspartyl protease